MGHYEQSLHRQQEIEEGLLQLMQEMAYEQITVKDLMEKLNLARKTFYHYFPSKKACLESLTDRLICECHLRQLQELPEEATAAQVYEIRLKYWIEHRQFLNAMIQNSLGSFFLNRFLQYLRRENKTLQEDLSRSTVQYDEDVLFFFMSGQLSLLLKWCHDGFPLSMDEMVQKNIRLVYEPLLTQKQIL